MKRFLPLTIIFVLFISSNLFSQGAPPLPINQNAKLYFNYDNAGNQVRIYFKFTKLARQKEEIVQDSIYNTALKENIFISLIDYFPNPTEGELTLDWSKSKGVYITSLQILTIDYKLIKTIKPHKTEQQTKIQFNKYASGIYLVKALFNNGEYDTFKVIKK